MLIEKIRRATYGAVSVSPNPDTPRCTASRIKVGTLSRIFRIPLVDFCGGYDDSRPVYPDFCGGYYDYFKEKYPIAGPAIAATCDGHNYGGNLAGMGATAFSLGASLVQLSAIGLDMAVVGGLMAAGAVAHAAAPLAMGAMGRKDENPQGLCAKLAWGAADGLLTPVMAVGYIGSRIGRVAGATFGMAIGASYGVARQGAIFAYKKALRPLYEKTLSPWLHRKPVETAKGKTRDQTSSIAHCPLPNYSVGANTAGLRLRGYFNKLMGKPPANSNMQQSASQPRPTGTSGPQNG